MVGRTERIAFIADCGRLHADFEKPTPYKTLGEACGLQISCLKSQLKSVFDGTATVQTLSATLDQEMKSPGVFQASRVPVSEAFNQGWQNHLHLHM